MTRGIRSCALAAGAAALLSAQAVYAAPTPAPTTSVDPLVTLSVLGTSQSRAAVCASGACALPATTLAASTAATAQGAPPPPGKTVNPWIMILGLAVLIGIIIAITSGGGDGSGDLTPVSPD